MTDFGLWVGGVMSHDRGSFDAIARNTMAVNLTAHCKKACDAEKTDIIMIVVPAGGGDDFMEKIIEAIGENPTARGEVWV